MVTQTSDSRPAAGQRRPGKRAGGRVRDTAPAAELPVAKVAVDIPLAHLDRPFDYLVPERMAADVVPGCRVRVRFSGKLVDGYVLERIAQSEHQGRLSYLDRVVSPEPVLTPELAGLARAVADRYAGTLADVLRLAVPPRHAATEAKPSPPAAGPPDRPAPGSWSRYPAGEAFLAGVADGRAIRAAWSALPGPEWPDEIAVAAATAAAAGRGTVIVVPDVKDLARVDAALTARLGPDQHVCLTADLGPSERYRRWLAVLRGSVRISAGTRAAMFAPVHDLGLVVLWDDGDDLHARTARALPARPRGAGAARAPAGRGRADRRVFPHYRGDPAGHLGLGPHAGRGPRSAAGHRAPDPDRGRGGRTGPGRGRAQLPAAQPGPAHGQGGPGPRPRPGPGAAARATWPRSPVAGAGPRLAAPCAQASWRSPPPGRFRTAGGAARSPRTGAASGAASPRCGPWSPGRRRTAEELGRAFPSVPVRFSGGQSVIASVPADPAVVVATPGAEPVAAAGYAGALLLDGWALLGRPSLRAAEEALRKWLNAAALARPGATVLISADASLPAVQALIRWDPVGHAERELAEREELGFPPAVRMAAVLGVGRRGRGAAGPGRPAR